MIPLRPENPDPSRFGNKFKAFLCCIATGLKTSHTGLAEFQHLMESEPPSNSYYKVGTWRLLVARTEEQYMKNPLLDEFPERFDTNSWEFEAFYSRRSVIDGYYHKIPRPILNRYIRALDWVPWKPELKARLDKIPLLHRTIGISVRTWQASHDDNPLAQFRARSFNPQKYLDIIKSYEGKVEKVFFSFDNPAAEKYFQDIKIPRISWSPNPLDPPIVTAAIKAQILGNCGLIVGDRLSTFIEAAWFMGKCQADVILVQ